MAEVGQWLRKNNIAPRDSLRFITSIKYDASIIKALNNMTFFYDAKWVNRGNTLPMSFFYIKDYTEMRTSEVSQKTLLFYNSGKADDPDAVKGGLLGVVADNIVNKPEKYKLDVVIPSSFTMIDKTYQFDLYSRNMMLLEQMKSLGGEGALPMSLSALSSTNSNIVAFLLKTLMTALTVEDTLSTDIITQMLTMDTANKDSLTAMWGNRTILKMKLPNGWKFKYVAIENMSINKKGEDGSYFTGTIEVTEVPVMTIDRSRRFSSGEKELGRFKSAGVDKFNNLINNMEKAFGQE